jgi:hypothetical protein
VRTDQEQRVFDALGLAKLAVTLADRSKDGWGLEDTVGQLIFGTARRLHSGLWIASMDEQKARRFCFQDYTDWARSTGRRAQQNTRLDLFKFQDLGMVVQHPKNDGDRTIWWWRCASALWDLFLMAEVVIGETGERGRDHARHFYVPSKARRDKMVTDLLEIHADTAERPFGRPAPARPAAPAVNVRARGPNGELRCSRCKTWKGEDEFSLRTDRKWLRKSRCKACMAAVARTRYLSIGKVEALNMALLSFKVSADDDLNGLTCVDCGEPFVAGDTVCSDGRLHHDRCDDKTGT